MSFATGCVVVYGQGLDSTDFRLSALLSNRLSWIEIIFEFIFACSQVLIRKCTLEYCNIMLCIFVLYLYLYPHSARINFDVLHTTHSHVMYMPTLRMPPTCGVDRWQTEQTQNCVLPSHTTPHLHTSGTQRNIPEQRPGVGFVRSVRSCPNCVRHAVADGFLRPPSHHDRTTAPKFAFQSTLRAAGARGR